MTTERKRKPLTEEQRQKGLEANRRWRARNPHRLLTPEQLAQEKARQQRYREKMTPEQRAKNNASKRKYDANLSPEKRRRWLEQKDAWRIRNPERVRAYREAWIAKNPDWRDKLKAASKKSMASIGEALELQLGKNTLYAAAAAAVTRRLPRDVRQDIVSAIVLAVLEGEIEESEIPRQAPRFINLHYRAFSKFGFVSLDMPVPGTDNMRWHEILPSPETQWSHL